MCGIVGLLIRDPAWEPRLGSMLGPMVTAMGPRGPDSCGVAIYGRGPDAGPAIHKVVGSTAVLVREADLAERTGHTGRTGRIAIAHTRMATESAVTADGTHPFAAGELTLIHNGSFSNYASVRRDLIAAGVVFESENDSEVCARLIAAELDSGASLPEAVGAVPRRLDGFFTILVATADALALARDRFGCKPAVVAEHPAYVAVASEYHALADLPDLAAARLFEPAADSIQVWTP